MAFLLFDTTITGPSVAINAALGDKVFVLPGVEIVNTAGNAAQAVGSDIQFRVNGTVIGSNVGLDASAAEGLIVDIAAGGTVGGVGGAGLIADDNATVTNAGEIFSQSTTQFAVELPESNASLSNSGTITGVNGVQLGDVFGEAESLRLVNSGTIAASGADGRTFTVGNAVALASAGSVLVNTASGLILNSGDDDDAVRLTSDASGNTVVRNFGEIQAAGGHALFGEDSDGTLTLENYGIMSGRAGSLLATAFADSVINGGRMVGSVDLMGGADRFDGRLGEVVGTIEAGGGNDTVSGGSNDDTVSGGFDDDRIGGGDGADVLSGEGGQDVIMGGRDADTIEGGDGNDTVRGSRGDDDLTGGAGEDEIIGGDGDDILRGANDSDQLVGGRGDDTLLGGAAADTLTGGEGDDNLTGGFGGDTFVFRGAFGADVIDDFAAPNSEKIDLSGVAPIQDFADLTAAHLSQVGANAVIEAGGGNTITLINTAASSLDAGDFIF